MRERQETREAKPGLSDDDKIRLQLYVDVHFLLGKLHELRAIDQVMSNLSPQTSGFEQFGFWSDQKVFYDSIGFSVQCYPIQT